MDLTRAGAAHWKGRRLTPRAWVWVLLLVAPIAQIGCRGGDAAAGRTADAERPPAVEAVPARYGSLPLEADVSGVVRADNQVTISSEISATVVAVLARNGDTVTAGQPLVRLDNATAAEQLRQAEANLRLAQATAAEARARQAEVSAEVTRTRALAAEALVSDLILETREAQLQAAIAQTDQAEARVEQAAATVEERRSAVAKTVIRAPVSGRVGQRDVEVGAVAEPGRALFLIGDFDDLVVEIPLTQSMLAHVSEGTPIEIDDGRSGSAPRRAAISRISPFLETSSFSTTAEIDIEEAGGLKPGMFVAVRVLYGESDRATLIPACALWEDPRSGSRLVFVVVDATGLAEPETPTTTIPDQPRTVVPRTVTTVADGRGRVGVREVEPGEWVVTVGQHLLAERLRAVGGTETAARVRPIPWDRVLELQGKQREDLLEGFLSKQRQVAKIFGADLPENNAAVEDALAGKTSDTEDNSTEAAAHGPAAMN